MSLFKGIKQSKERQKAKAFYESAINLPAGTRETRKLRSVLGNRTSAFIDMTFIDGAKRTEAYIEAINSSGTTPPEKPSAPCYREVRTVGAMYGFTPSELLRSVFYPWFQVSTEHHHQQGYLRSPIRLPLRSLRHSCWIIILPHCNF